MKKMLMFLAVVAANDYAYANALEVPMIIPEPVKMNVAEEFFMLSGKTPVITQSSDERVKRVCGYLRRELLTATGSEFPVLDEQKKGEGILLRLLPEPDPELGSEGYRMNVDSKGVDISANTPAGLFYGVQTLLQLLPSQAMKASTGESRSWPIPYVEIVDYPRFKWRGLMLDVSRHFFTKEEVMHFIDQMARYKLNIFHWHLTDDQGWRIEIEKYPRLTEVGAWRVPRQGNWWSYPPPQPGEEPTYGGFYTQDDIREVVAYARERFIEIMPEIDVPGHAMAILAAYPELSCTGGPFEVNPGSEFYGRIENTVCAGQERTYDFVDDVMREVAALFPFDYIHMGGDEVHYGFWDQCPRCKAVREKNNLADSRELQSYFVRRTEDMIESHGKKLIGWDEIMYGGLSPNATVMSWRGVDGGIKAAGMGHDVIMSPSPFYYLDLYQGDPAHEPNTYNFASLRMAFDFEPVSADIDDPSRILGVQGNLWTESVPTMRHAEYMTWPRAFAVAETGWSPADRKAWPNFFRRVEHHFDRFRVMNWNYAPSVYDPIIEVFNAEDGSLRIRLHTEAPDLYIHYTFTVAHPDTYYPIYTEPLSVPIGASALRIITARNGTLVGRPMKISIEDVRRRAE
jgi:hexosaminidase